MDQFLEIVDQYYINGALAVFAHEVVDYVFEWKSSTENGRLRITRPKGELYLERVWKIAILSLIPCVAVRYFQGEWPRLLWIAITFSLSTFVVFRWWGGVSGYLLDKERDRFCRDGEFLCQLSDVDHVRIYEDEESIDAYVVLKSGIEGRSGGSLILVDLDPAPEIADYIGVKLEDDREDQT